VEVCTLVEYSDSPEAFARAEDPRRSESGTGRAPLTLALDTGSPITSVALARSGKVLGRASFASGEAEATLLGEIDRLLKEAGFSIRDLERLIGARGPGSFTGLRIGLSTLLGLHQALKVRSTAVSSFLPLARQGVGDLPVIAVVDALRGEWFAQRFLAEPSKSVDTDAVIVRPEELPRWAPCQIVGFGVGTLRRKIPDRAGIELHEAAPLAPQLAALAESPDLDWDASTLTCPFYLRPPATAYR
jgi:tRNA threonylcarbamoyl adenosine modification protein YeaZ